MEDGAKLMWGNVFWAEGTARVKTLGQASVVCLGT